MAYRPGPEFTKTSNYGPRVHPFTGELKNHDGQDFAAARGTEVPAAVAGEVWYTGRNASFYGNTVILLHQGENGTYFFTMYAHLDDSIPLPRLGDLIDAGETVGAVGNSGLPNGATPHLHYEVISDGVPNRSDSGGQIGISSGVGRTDPEQFNYRGYTPYGDDGPDQSVPFPPEKPEFLRRSDFDLREYMDNTGLSADSVDSDGNAEPEYTPGQMLQFSDDMRGFIEFKSLDGNNFFATLALTDAQGAPIGSFSELPDGGNAIVDFDAEHVQNWNRQVTGYDSDGNLDFQVTRLDDGNIGSVQRDGQPLQLGDLGAALGSQLGQRLGGNSLVAQAIGGTLIGAIGQQIGQSLQYGTSFSLEQVVVDAEGQLHPGFGGSLSSQAAGQISSLLIAELAHSLHLNGFETGLLQSVGGSITTQLVSNLGNFLASGGSNADLLFQGFSSAGFFTNMSGNIAGFFADQLAHEIVLPQNQAGSIGGQIGGAIGAWLGTLIPIPLIGTAVGRFLGEIGGTLVGNLAGDGPKSSLQINVDETGHLFVTPAHEENGGNAQAFQQIADHQAKVVNALMDFMGAGIDRSHSPGAGLAYFQEGQHFWVNGKNGLLFGVGPVSDMHQIEPMVNKGLMSLLTNIDTTGGDVLMRRAFENAKAVADVPAAAPNPGGEPTAFGTPGASPPTENASAFATALMVAHDYRTYLDNAPLINIVMAAAPESSFTAGWALTLLKARELGLDQASAKDFQGGMLANLGTRGIADKLDWAPDYDARQPDTLVLHNPNGGADFRLDNAFGPGPVKSLAGGAGDDTLGLSLTTLHSVTHVAGGAGNDTIAGSASTGLLDGGPGNDTITGGAGPDLLDGNDGDDSLFARDGQNDLIRGGAGNDTAQGDEFGVDNWDGVENVDATPPVVTPPVVTPPAGDTTASAVGLSGGTKKVRVRSGKASVSLALTCPAAEAGGCKGTVALISSKAVKIGNQRVRVVVGNASYTLKAGEKKNVTVRLPKNVRKLAVGRKLKVRAQTITRDAAGNVASDSRSLTLRIPAKK
jgi:hypothetical protein